MCSFNSLVTSTGYGFSMQFTLLDEAKMSTGERAPSRSDISSEISSDQARLYKLECVENRNCPCIAPSAGCSLHRYGWWEL